LENTKPGFFIIARPDLALPIDLVILDSKIKRLKKKRGTWYYYGPSGNREIVESPRKNNARHGSQKLEEKLPAGDFPWSELRTAGEAIEELGADPGQATAGYAAWRAQPGNPGRSGIQPL